MKNKKDKNYNRFEQENENRFDKETESKNKHNRYSFVTLKTHNEKDDIDINMTHLLGYVEVSYNKLVEVFGEPMLNTSSKTDASWDIEFSDGKVASIYCWKNYGVQKIENITDWNIGGHDESVVERIKTYLKKFKGIQRINKLNRVITFR